MFFFFFEQILSAGFFTRRIIYLRASRDRNFFGINMMETTLTTPQRIRILHTFNFTRIGWTRSASENLTRAPQQEEDEQDTTRSRGAPDRG